MKTTLCAIAAEFELPYIKEWLRYHFDLGFSDAKIYLNNWSELGLDYLKYTDFGGKVVFKIFDGKVQQLNAYNDCLRTTDSDWCAFLDCDEFIYLKEDIKISEFLERYDNVPQLGLNWLLFGSSGIVDRDADKSVLLDFIHSDTKLNKHTKQIVHISKLKKLGILDKMQFVNPHFTNGISANVYGHAYWNAWNNEIKQISETPAFIAHYVTKSLEECRFRRSQVRADTPTPRPEGWEAFFKEHDKNDILNTSLRDRQLSYNGINVIK